MLQLTPIYRLRGVRGKQTPPADQDSSNPGEKVSAYVASYFAPGFNACNVIVVVVSGMHIAPYVDILHRGQF